MAAKDPRCSGRLHPKRAAQQYSSKSEHQKSTSIISLSLFNSTKMFSKVFHAAFALLLVECVAARRNSNRASTRYSTRYPTQITTRYPTLRQSEHQESEEHFSGSCELNLDPTPRDASCCVELSSGCACDFESQCTLTDEDQRFRCPRETPFCIGYIKGQRMGSCAANVSAKIDAAKKRAERYWNAGNLWSTPKPCNKVKESEIARCFFKDKASCNKHFKFTGKWPPPGNGYTTCPSFECGNGKCTCVAQEDICMKITIPYNQKSVFDRIKVSSVCQPNAVEVHSDLVYRTVRAEHGQEVSVEFDCKTESESGFEGGVTATEIEMEYCVIKGLELGAIDYHISIEDYSPNKVDKKKLTKKCNISEATDRPAVDGIVGQFSEEFGAPKNDVNYIVNDYAEYVFGEGAAKRSCGFVEYLKEKPMLSPLYDIIQSLAKSRLGRLQCTDATFTGWNSKVCGIMNLAEINSTTVIFLQFKTEDLLQAGKKLFSLGSGRQEICIAFNPELGLGAFGMNMVLAEKMFPPLKELHLHEVAFGASMDSAGFARDVTFWTDGKTKVRTFHGNIMLSLSFEWSLSELLGDGDSGGGGGDDDEECKGISCLDDIIAITAEVDVLVQIDNNDMESFQDKDTSDLKNSCNITTGGTALMDQDKTKELIKPKGRKAQFTSLVIHLQAQIEVNLEDISKGLLKNPLVLAQIVANIAIVRGEGFYFYLHAGSFLADCLKWLVGLLSSLIPLPTDAIDKIIDFLFGDMGGTFALNIFKSGRVEIYARMDLGFLALHLIDWLQITCMFGPGTDNKCHFEVGGGLWGALKTGLKIAAKLAVDVFAAAAELFSGVTHFLTHPVKDFAKIMRNPRGFFESIGNKVIDFGNAIVGIFKKQKNTEPPPQYPWVVSLDPKAMICNANLYNFALVATKTVFSDMDYFSFGVESPTSVSEKATYEMLNESGIRDPSSKLSKRYSSVKTKTSGTSAGIFAHAAGELSSGVCMSDNKLQCSDDGDLFLESGDGGFGTALSNMGGHIRIWTDMGTTAQAEAQCDPHNAMAYYVSKTFLDNRATVEANMESERSKAEEEYAAQVKKMNPSGKEKAMTILKGFCLICNLFKGFLQTRSLRSRENKMQKSLPLPQAWSLIETDQLHSVSSALGTGDESWRKGYPDSYNGPAPPGYTAKQGSGRCKCTNSGSGLESCEGPLYNKKKCKTQIKIGTVSDVKSCRKLTTSNSECNGYFMVSDQGTSWGCQCCTGEVSFEDHEFWRIYSSNQEGLCCAASPYTNPDPNGDDKKYRATSEKNLCYKPIGEPTIVKVSVFEDIGKRCRSSGAIRSFFLDDESQIKKFYANHFTVDASKVPGNGFVTSVSNSFSLTYKLELRPESYLSLSPVLKPDPSCHMWRHPDCRLCFGEFLKKRYSNVGMDPLLISSHFESRKTCIKFCAGTDDDHASGFVPLPFFGFCENFGFARMTEEATQNAAVFFTEMKNAGLILDRTDRTKWIRRCRSSLMLTANKIEVTINKNAKFPRVFKNHSFCSNNIIVGSDLTVPQCSDMIKRKQKEGWDIKRRFFISINNHCRACRDYDLSDVSVSGKDYTIYSFESSDFPFAFKANAECKSVDLGSNENISPATCAKLVRNDKRCGKRFLFGEKLKHLLYGADGKKCACCIRGEQGRSIVYKAPLHEGGLLGTTWTSNLFSFDRADAPIVRMYLPAPASKEEYDKMITCKTEDGKECGENVNKCTSTKTCGWNVVE